MKNQVKIKKNEKKDKTGENLEKTKKPKLYQRIKKIHRKPVRKQKRIKEKTIENEKTTKKGTKLELEQTYSERVTSIMGRPADDAPDARERDIALAD